MLIDWLVDYLAKKLKMGDALEALRAGQLHVNFEGGQVSGENLVSAFPAKSMFLLSRGKLAEEYRGHRGRVWQCQLCSRSDSKRNNVIKQRCTSKNGKHRRFFDEDQSAILGNHAARKGGKPMYLPRDSQPAIAQPTPVSTSLCLPLLLLPCLHLLTLLNSGCRSRAQPWLPTFGSPGGNLGLCVEAATGRDSSNFNGWRSWYVAQLSICIAESFDYLIFVALIFG